MFAEWTQIMRTLFASLLLSSALASAALAETFVAYTSELPPVVNAEGAEPAGVTLEILLEMEKRSGVDLDIRFVPLARAAASVAAEPNTLWLPPVRSPDREPDYNWVAEVLASNLIFVSKDTAVNSYDAAKALSKIAVVRDGVTHKLLASQGFENLHLVPNSTQAAKLVEGGRVDAWFAVDLESIAVIRNMGADVAAFTMGESVRQNGHWLASNHSFDAATAEALAKALESMRADGSYDAIVAKYK